MIKARLMMWMLKREGKIQKGKTLATL